MVIDGLPVIPKDSRDKLIKFLLRKLQPAGKVKDDSVFMPVNEKGMTEGYYFVFNKQLSRG